LGALSGKNECDFFAHGEKLGRQACAQVAGGEQGKVLFASRPGLRLFADKTGKGQAGLGKNSQVTSCQELKHFLLSQSSGPEFLPIG
jgi:hypothetical protein